MRDYLITDFLQHTDFKNIKSKKYLEIPKFDKKFNLSKDVIFYKDWKTSKNKIRDIKKNIKIYNHFLGELTIYLNNYHRKQYSKRYWEIMIGTWLYWFISSITFKWNLIESLKNRKYFFFKKEINQYDLIPHGIEDYTRISISNYWNHHFFSRIIEYNFSNKILIQKKGKILNNRERNIIYKNLNMRNIKDRISLLIQKILNLIPQRKGTLIFSTYMSNLQELWLNMLVNGSLLYYKTLRPNVLFEKEKIFKFHRKKYKGLKSKGTKLEKFLSQEILSNIPTSFLENYEYVNDLVEKIPFPKKPKKIFTCLGIIRNTLMDRYIAKNVENGSTLILAQHGGSYFQHKNHFNSIFETRISDKYLSWGNLKTKKTIPFGVIKNLKISKKNSNKIILVVRMRRNYNREIKIYSGYQESQNYLKSLFNLLLLIKNDKFLNNFYLKLHPAKTDWYEKKQFLSIDSNLRFIDENKKMTEEMKTAKIIIQTTFSSGHLESLAINKPTLVYLSHNLDLLENKSKKYLAKFKKLGIVHTEPKSLFKLLKKLNKNDGLEKWWYQKKIQDLILRYKNDYCILNKNKINDLKNIIDNG